jgi:membrane-anchored protein YejM (alkaline phosphatase superfamily)
MTRWGFIAGRVVVAAVCLLTWAFGLIVSVRFAYEQFIRPQLFPWVTEFVNWHHVWYWVAFAISVATIVPQLRSLTADGGKPIAGWLSLGYVFCFGGIGIYLVANPYLALLDGGTQSLALVPGALVPLLWLAAIDHTASGSPEADQRGDVTGQRRLFDAALATAVSLWLIHVAVAATRSDLSGGWPGWFTTAAWALVLDVTAALALALALSLTATIAATARRPFACEYALTVVLIGAAVTEFVRRFVLPSLTFTGADAALTAVPFGATMALMWSGWRVRHRRRNLPPDTALGFLTSLADGRSSRSLLLACLVPIVAAIASRLVETVDWALIMNRLIALTEATLVFGFFLSRFRDRQADDSWSASRMVVAPLAALLVVSMLPWATSTAGALTTNPQIDSELALDRLPLTDPIGATVARLWVEQQVPDMDYYREMIASNSAQSAARPIVPETTFARDAYDVGPRPPHVFIFLIDSLRRDYLSTYNPAAAFTPALASFANDSYVFSNAFTTYGGTWMAIPSLWSGAALTRGWGQIFKQINVLEPLIASANYDFVINDYTVESELTPSTRRTFLNPGVTSVNTDLCDNVAALQSHIDRRATPARPVFSFIAPMNVHILNTRSDAGPADPRYDGFYPSYAARLERLDGCFGSFITDLQQRGWYDDSIIIVTSDHGDTLGTDGNWGHQFFLFPEDVRIPLIIHLPRAMRRSVTTDLARVAVLPDLAPTLLALLGQQVPDLQPPFGSPLFVAPDREPRPRRRESFLLMSSYGSTYGLLRRNGKFLYISDLVSWREYAYTLFKQPLGERVPVTDAHRRIGQAGIRAHVKAVDEVYRKK